MTTPSSPTAAGSIDDIHDLAIAASELTAAEQASFLRFLALSLPSAAAAGFIDHIHDLGMAQLAAGDFDQASFLLSSALDLRLQIAEKGNPMLLRFARDLAFCFCLAGRHDDAKRFRQLFLKAFPEAEPPRPSLR